MEEKDLFPEITGFSIPKQAQDVLRSQNVNITQFQKQINDDIAAGGQKKAQRIQQTYTLMDQVLGGTYYSNQLAASMPLTQQEVLSSYGNTSGKQNVLGQFWNSSVPALIEGVGKLGAAIPAIFEGDDKDWNARNKAVEGWIRPMLTYVDESFSSATPISYNKEKGEVDFSNLTSGAAWANTAASLLGFMAPMLATAGVGGIVRGVAGAGKVAEGFSAIGEIADLAANGAKLDKFGKALMGVEFTTSTAMMFPEYQKLGIDNGLTIGEATKMALPLAIVNGAIELIGGQAFAKGLGFTTADANKIIREVTLQNADNVLAGLRTGAKLDELAFQDIVESVAKNTINTLADKSQQSLWKKIGGKVLKSAKDQGLPEGAEEFLQSSSEELAKAIYNSTVDPSLPEGKGRFGDFDPKEYATNTLFGTFLGGLMGTGMGMLHKNPKAFDQTLFNYIAADVQSKVANGAQSIDEIVPRLKAFKLSEKGLSEGHYDQSEKDQIDKKIANMAQVALEFVQSPEVGKSERFAMYRLTQTQNDITESESAIAQDKQILDQTKQEIASGSLSPKTLIDANKTVSELSGRLGAYNQDTNTYEAEDRVVQKKAATGRIMQETAKAMSSKATSEVGAKYLKNEISKVNDEPMAVAKYAVDGNKVVILESDGKSGRLVKAELRPLQVEPLNANEDSPLAFTAEKYQPRTRAEIVVSPLFDGVEDYAQAEATYNGTKNKASDEADLTTSVSADAQEVLDIAKSEVMAHNNMLMPEQEMPIEEKLTPLYDYYTQIQDYDTDGKAGVTKYDTKEKFFEAAGVVTEAQATDAAEAGVTPEELNTQAATQTQPEKLSELSADEIKQQADQTNEFYDEGLVEQQIKAFVEANGIEPQVSIPEWVDVAIRRAESALPMQPSALKEASDYLYRLYKQFENSKKASNRMYTIEQINEMLELIGADIELLQSYINAYEDGTASEFTGRNQEAQTTPNAQTALPDAQPGTPNTEPTTQTANVDGNAQTQPQSDTGAGLPALDVQSEFTYEQERAGIIADARSSIQDAAAITEGLTDAIEAEDDAKLDAAISAAELVTEQARASLEKLNAGTTQESSNQDSGANGVAETPSEQLTSKQVRKQLEALRRTPQSFREAVLWYFSDGGQVRREDVIRFVGEGAISSGKGGNAYLSYINDQAQPYDTVLYRIAESMGYNSVSEVGEETDLLNQLFDTFTSFYGTSPNRMLLRMLLEESVQQSEPMFEGASTEELLAGLSVDESTLSALSEEDINAFEAFLRTLPNNVDPTNPQQVFEAFLEYSENGWPPMSESGMKLVDTVVAQAFVSDPNLSPEFKQVFEPIIESYNNEQLRQNEPTTAEASTSSAVASDGQSQGQTSKRIAKPKPSKSETLDAEKQQITDALKDKFARFAKAGRGQASSSLIGVTPEQIEIAGEIIADLSKLGINRFQKAIAWVAENIGVDFLKENFVPFQSAYVSAKIVNRDFSEDFNEIGKASLEDILTQNQQENVSSTALPLEPNSPRGGAGDALGSENVQSDRAGVLPPTGNGGDIVGESGLRFSSNSGIPANDTVTVRDSGDPDLYPRESENVVAERDARLVERKRSSPLGRLGLPTNQPTTEEVTGTSTEDDPRTAKLNQQRAAESVAVQGSELDNIVETLPFLLPHQHTNVQKAEVRLLEKNEKGILFTDGTGTGKAQPLWSKVFTPDGWTTMGQLKKGDYVMSVDGTPTLVTGVFDRGVKSIYKVTMSDGAFTYTCDEHLWETQTLYQRRKNTTNPNANFIKPKVLELKEIMQTLDKRHFIPIAKPVELTEKQFYIDPYIIGVLIGDGCISHTTTEFSNFHTDTFIEDRVRGLLPEGYILKRQIEKGRCDSCIITKENPTHVGKYEFNEEIERLCLRFKRSYEKTIPASYLLGSIAQRIALLQGLLDTDGWVDKKTKSAYYGTGSEELANAVVELVNSLGGVATKKQKEPKFTYKGEIKQGRLFYSICINLPSEVMPFTLPRKAALYKPNYKYLPKRVIVKIEFFSKEPTRCIEVEHERSLYLTDNYIVTHNTLTALGIAKRFLKRGAKNILIVTPSDKKVKDWVEEAKFLNIEASGLSGLNDKGQGVSVTTYANFGQNQELSKRTFDLIIYDESHNILSNEKGETTLALQQHRELAKPPLTAYYKAREEYVPELSKISRKKQEAIAIADNNALSLLSMAALDIENNKIPQRTQELIAQTKVVFLSATPFAYHKNIPYADGFLFNASQKLTSDFKPDSTGSRSGMDTYMMAVFGYRIRNGNLTLPETGVDVSLMERNWLDSLRDSGAVSSTKLDIPQDYSREFVLLSEEGEKFPIGALIDEGLKIIHDSEEFKNLSEAVNKKMDYLYKNRLLEQIKVRLGIDRIKKHIDAGRKVVVFHSYNEGITTHPFDFSYLGDPELMSLNGIEKAKIEAAAFNRKYPQYAKIDLSGMASVPNAIAKAFGDSAVLFNGSIPKGKRSENIKKFNEDGSSTSIVVVNIAAGEAGLNLHDTTGKHQRVVVQLGLPIRPTSAIQSEGRIYRTNLKTNAIFEYFVTHFNFEKYAFGSKINERSGTAENLAMGNEARDLKVSFKEGYLNPTTEDPSKNQGSGGKTQDYTRGTMSLFQKAITYYYARAKKTAKTKSAEGTDYFATPEPLGMKMVEWLGAVAGDKLLEPSAGHGAIARFFPESTDNIMIEPSTQLRSDLTVNAHGTTVGGTFEQLSLVNKFDGIAMNPPFGSSAKTAMEHVEKAVKHLRDQGRLVALVPTGQMDKRLEKYLYATNEKGKLENPDAENLHLAVKILLPTSTFERAGTQVATQILIFDKQTDPEKRKSWQPTQNIDLRSADTVADLFTRLENLEVRKRERDTESETIEPVAEVQPQTQESTDAVNPPVKAFHAKNQKDVFVVQTSGKLTQDQYARVKGISTRHKGYYSSFKDNKGAVPGFQFNTLEDAKAFYKEVNGKDAPAAQMMFGNENQSFAQNGTSNVIDLLSQRFEGQVTFRTPTEEEFLAKQKELSPDSREAAYGFYDPIAKEVWLNPATKNVNTPIHEIAHPWVGWVKANNPELYQRGMELMNGSSYMKELFKDPNYRGLTIEELTEEALVRAIADQGEKFITAIRKRGFLEWFNELFDAIKEFLGIRNLTAEQVSKLSLEEFAKMAAADILAGQDTRITDTGIAASLSDEAVMKPLFSFSKNTFDFTQLNRQDVTNYSDWQDHINYALSKIPTATLVKTPAQMDSKDRRAIDAVFAQTGVKYKGNGQWDFDLSKSPDTAFLADGTLVRMDKFGQASNQKGVIATTYRNGFVKLYNKKGWDGDAFRFVVNNLRGLMNIETMASLLDDGSGIITSLINDAKRVGGRNKARVSNIIQPKRWKIAQLAKELSIYEGINTIWTAKRVEIETYTWDEVAQDVVRKKVEVPIATAMSMVLTADTQESMGDKYGGTSVVINDRFIDQNGDLVDLAQTNPNLSADELLKLKKSVIFSQAKNVHRGAKISHPVLEKQGNDYVEIDNATLLLSRSQLEDLRNRFTNGVNITSDAETEVFSALKEAFNNAQVRDMIKREDEQFLNFGTEFLSVPDYFPINSADGQAQINDRVRYRPALEDSKLLNERISAPKSVYIGDALDALEDYEYRVGNILEHGRLSHNITTIANALRTEIPDDPMVRQMSQWLLDRRELIEDWRGYKASRADKFANTKFFNLVLGRYTSSIFRLNFGMAAKQLATFLSASKQSMLKDEYLFNSKTVKELLSLSRGMVTDTVTGVGQEVVEGTDVGFVDKLGNKSVQADLLREILGENITDPAEKELHQSRYATVIERLLYSQNAYVGGVDFDKVTFNSKGYSFLKKIFGKADDWMENIGMTPMRISDRAVILSYYVAAKDQVADEVAAGEISQDAYSERVAEVLESVLYATNQMSKVADMTTMQTSTNWLSKLLGLYSGQTQKLLNVFLQSMVNSIHHPDDVEAKARFRRSLITNALYVPAYLATVTTAWSILKAWANGDEPKEYDYYQQQFLWNLAKNASSVVPGLAEQSATFIISQIDNEPWSDSILDFPGDETLSGTVESAKDLYNWGAASDNEEAGKYADSFYYNIEKAVAGWTGTPKVATRFIREHTTTDKDDLE